MTLDRAVPRVIFGMILMIRTVDQRWGNRGRKTTFNLNMGIVGPKFYTEVP